MLNDASMQLPWYRHRWPWLLAAGPLTVIVAGAITTWLAASGNTALVADDYYKQGLSINRVIERERVAQELGIGSTVSSASDGPASTRLSVRLQVREGVATPARLRVRLIHPTRSELDRELLLDGRSGLFEGSIHALQQTHWKLVIEDEARSWRINDTLAVEANRDRD